MNDWNDNELDYCTELVRHRGDHKVGTDPKTVATYLRLMAAQAFRDQEWEISSRLGMAATCINEDARNNHEPHWDEAWKALDPWTERLLQGHLTVFR